MKNNNNFLPLFINLKNKKVLIIGAGKIAFRKVSTVAEYGANIKILTNKVMDPRFSDLILENSLVKLNIGEFKKDFIKKECLDSFLVILATDDKKFNEELAMYCDENNVLVNNITSKNIMNTRFCSVLKKEEYTLGISANGDPKKSKALKNKLSSVDFRTIP
ncbi:bifunctional precorrin-2 dehydrogenase/sirohydrochlorin ferrochelatase [Fusobacterium sp. MFO224]|uniref:precorrin-2 dehydrogenase/sirohydrochlorin ferrochelatase family protein n=1 Tax=Fusobacterium sp. MFO224 TaxID=3378070 RepID=UPI00385253EE